MTNKIEKYIDKILYYSDQNILPNKLGKYTYMLGGYLYEQSNIDDPLVKKFMDNPKSVVIDELVEVCNKTVNIFKYKFFEDKYHIVIDSKG